MVRRIAFSMVTLLITTSPTYAVQVGWSVDVHQNEFIPCADDYHVWGVLQSMPGQNGPVSPTLISQDNLEPYDHYQGTNCYSGIFDHFSYQIGGAANPNLPRPTGYPAGQPWPPTSPPFYYFEANWWSDENCVEFCHWAHFGLKFEEQGQNVAYWLQGKWTAAHGAEYADGTTPMLGFSISDGAGGALRLGTGTIITPPEPPPPVLPDGALSVSSLQLAALPVGADFPIENLGKSFFGESLNTPFVFGGQTFNWSGNLTPTPQYLAPDSFFDVFLESVAVPGTGGSQNFAQLLPGQIILARQQLSYSFINLQTGLRQTDTFWQYELHGVVPEPSSLVLLASAAIVLLSLARCKRGA
jgi:hypothetical protein